MIDHIQIPKSLTVKALGTWAVVAVVGVTAAFTVADAAGGAKQTYVGSGALYGTELSAVVPASFSTDLQVFGDRIRVKGEVNLIDGQVVGGSLIGAGVQIDFDAPDDQQLSLRISTHDDELQFDLLDASVSVGSHLLLIDMVLVDGDVTYSIGLELDNSEVFTLAAGDSRTASGGIGPDVTVSRVGLTKGPRCDDGNPCFECPEGTCLVRDDFAYYGAANGIRAFSMASTSCNVGDQTAEWIEGSSGRHPVIAQNVFRLLGGRFEHIGQSWLKHSFCALSENSCGTCQATDCNTLSIGCADTYWATLNDGRSGKAKSRINPQGFGTTGGIANTHIGPDPHPAPTGHSTTRGRLQIQDSDITAGGQNFAEIQYVTHDEPFDNRHNNASWRQVIVTLTNITGDPPDGGLESVHFMEPAIMAWGVNDPNAEIEWVDVPGEGRFYYGTSVTDNGDGTWHYEYAIQNLNSDRSAGLVSIPVPDGLTLTNVGFHDVSYHSGDPYSGADWIAQVIDAACTWTTETYAQNQSANALRWGTLYNFRFDADTPPISAMATIGLFKPGTPDSVTAATLGPDMATTCAEDLDGDGEVNAFDLAQLLGNWGPCDEPCEPGDPATTCAADLDGNCDVGPFDLALLLGHWGPCP